jgi:hypothetical protein
VFNLVSLKYIHLNSDILTQAIAIRLRNFKKNRLNKVLRKVLRLVAVSRVNPYASDIHNPIYKYLEQHFNKFRQLNLNIFKDITVNTAGSNYNAWGQRGLDLNHNYNSVAFAPRIK